jgi:hypothetical protein
MKILLGFCVSIFLIFLFPILGFAQEPSKPEVQINYDKFKDQTLYLMSGMQVTGNTYEGIQIGAGFTCAGKADCTPPAIGFYITTFVKGYNFFKNRELIILADENRFKLGDMHSMGRKELSEGLVQYEILATPLSVDIFTKICNAKKVEMQLGNVEFELKDTHLEALRALSKQVGGRK